MYEKIIRSEVTNFALMIEKGMADEIFQRLPRLRHSPVTRRWSDGRYGFRTEPWLLCVLEEYNRANGSDAINDTIVTARNGMRRKVRERLLPFLQQERRPWRRSRYNARQLDRIRELLANVHEGMGVAKTTCCIPSRLAARHPGIDLRRVINSVSSIISVADVGRITIMDNVLMSPSELLRAHIEIINSHGRTINRQISINLDWGHIGAGSAVSVGITLSPTNNLLRQEPSIELEAIVTLLHEFGHILGEMMGPPITKTCHFLGELPARCMEQLALTEGFCCSLQQGGDDKLQLGDFTGLAAYRTTVDAAISEFDLQWNCDASIGAQDCLQSLKSLLRQLERSSVNDLDLEGRILDLLIELPQLFGSGQNYSGKYYWYIVLEWLVKKKLFNSELYSNERDVIGLLLASSSQDSTVTVRAWMDAAGCGKFKNLLS